MKRTIAAMLMLTVLAGCVSEDTNGSAADIDGAGTADGVNEEVTADSFEQQEPAGTCGTFDSLEPVLPTTADPTGLALGWPLLQLDVAMIADPSFQENHTHWEDLLHQLVADANVHYEEQVGIRWNVSLVAGLPNGSLQAGVHDGQQRDVARGFLAAHHPDAEWDIVAVILGDNYDGSVAGQVECVHGLAYKDYAYLWSEYTRNRTAGEFMGLGIFEDIPLKVFMHEAAHLLAAHHHYTNCGLPLVGYGTNDALAVCGTMINDIGLASYRFSETNRLVMRSFVEDLGVADPVG